MNNNNNDIASLKEALIQHRILLRSMVEQIKNSLINENFTEELYCEWEKVGQLHDDNKKST